MFSEKKIRVTLSNKVKHFMWNLVIVYSDPQPTGKETCLVELVNIIKKSQIPIVFARILI
jgi:hypothetical protein